MSPWRSDSSLFRGRVTVIFAYGADPSSEALARVDADVETAEPAAVAMAIARRRRHGGVVVVVPSEEDRRAALALGADEAMTRDQLEPARLSKAIARAASGARLRARARLGAPEGRHAPELGLYTLSRAIGALVESPNGARPGANAQGNWDTPRNDELRTLAVATRELWAMEPMMSEPPPCDATLVVGRLAAVLDGALRSTSRFSFHSAHGPRLVPMRASRIVYVTAALLRRAKHAVNDRPDGAIELSLLADDDGVVIEVRDNREELPPENGDRVPWAEPPPAVDPDLADIEEDVRRAGGEVLVDCDDVLGHGVRIFLPPVASGPAAPRGDVN